MIELIECLNNLTQNSKLERDRAEESLLLKNYEEENKDILIQWIQQHLDDKENIEICIGCLTGCKILLTCCKNISVNILKRLSDEFLIYQASDEYRIRLLSGECMGLLVGICGVVQFNKYIKCVKDGLRSNISSRSDTDTTALKDKLSSEEVFHDTAGWKSLETWMKCFQAVINGLGAEFHNIVNNEMIDVIFEAMDHKNRFVRETGYALIGTVAEQDGCRDNTIYQRVCRQLRRGLCDNWSQVRMAACVATRTLLMHHKKSQDGQEEKQLDQFTLEILMPPLCLNRHYLAEGVRLYSQQTWRLVFGGSNQNSEVNGGGKELLAQFMPQTVNFLIEQSDADNHAVREAACACLAELAAKIEAPDVVEPLLGSMLDALLICFQDDSWPVRDVACLATGRLLATYPLTQQRTQATGHSLDRLLPLFVANLTDSISSVREGAAGSIGSVLAALPQSDTNHQTIIEFVLAQLANVKDQKHESAASAAVDRVSPAVFGVVKGSLGPESREGENEDVRHTDQTMFSCGSLAPRMSKGRAKGGCHDGHFKRHSDLWEKADGCVTMAFELCVSVKYLRQDQSDQLINAVVASCSYEHYPHHVYLLATACRAVQRLCEGLPKQQFKRHLDTLLPLLDRAVQADDCSLTVAAAEDCIRTLSVRLGANIVRGRIEMQSSQMLAKVAHLFI